MLFGMWASLWKEVAIIFFLSFLLSIYIYLHFYSSNSFFLDLPVDSCIEKWLKNSHAKCPTCNTKARKRDIRLLYSAKITVIDNSKAEQDLEFAMNQLQKEQVNILYIILYNIYYHPFQ